MWSTPRTSVESGTSSTYIQGRLDHLCSANPKLLQETTGQTATFAAAGRDGPSSPIVVLQVCDNRTACATASTTVNIGNGAPTATFTAPSAVEEGHQVVLSLTNPTDPSPADNAAGFTYAFDCGTGAGFGPFGAAAYSSCATADNGSRP
jgi:hypothetical protein